MRRSADLCGLGSICDGTPYQKQTNTPSLEGVMQEHLNNLSIRDEDPL